MVKLVSAETALIVTLLVIAFIACSQAVGSQTHAFIPLLAP